MNDPLNPMEDMLRRFRPRSVSATKRQQLAEQITATRSRRRVTTSLGVLALAVAACLLVVALFQTGSSHDVAVESNHEIQVADAAPSSDQFAPTVWAYRRAAEQSLEELDSLLAHHAQELLSPEDGSIVSLQQRFP